MLIRKNTILLTISLLAAAAAVGFWFIAERHGPYYDAGDSATDGAVATASDLEEVSGAAPPAASGVALQTDTPMSLIEEMFGADDPAWAWAKVDLEAVQRQLPDNLYWELSAPTEDPFILDKRAQTRAHWEQMYGKVLSNTGTEAEVRDYYQWRNRLSTDHVEFTTHMIENYGQVLPERDLRLLELARTLHLARLEQLPRDLAVALERREAHQQARDAWLAGEAEFSDSRPDKN
ncbi:hypothetical protein FKG94_23845 [Exilibacterium tricleocarpae]|uniref:Uncharacterized protein n=1 Tax=Exilibacterium tricleocarpae TaxID=2591008 RepID=A0A545ST42_9GAMM|nr:hypothetical protein [Exilibacterium tricleocarpae]TQV68127.1 hypothetical protein FKG94_23845 [Exilibacterium tricleocarpae]